MPITTELELIKYNPNDPAQDPIPLGQCAVDGPNHLVRCALGNIPTANGGRIEIIVVTIYARGSAINTTIQDQFINAEQGASDGIFELLLSDESLQSNYECDLRAAAELNLRTQPNYSLSFDTRLDGFEVGDQIRFIDEAPGIDVMLTIQSINSRLVGTVGLVDEFIHSITAAPYVIDPNALLSRAIQLSSLPNMPRNPIIGA